MKVRERMVDRIASAKVYKAGQDAMLASDFRSAKTSFLWASSLDPENVLFVHAAAGAACSLGQYREAEGLYRKAISLAERTVGPDHTKVADCEAGLRDFLRGGASAGDTPLT